MRVLDHPPDILVVAYNALVAGGPAEELMWSKREAKGSLPGGVVLKRVAQTVDGPLVEQLGFAAWRNVVHEEWRKGPVSRVHVPVWTALRVTATCIVFVTTRDRGALEWLAVDVISCDVLVSG